MGMFVVSNIVGSTIQITTLPLPVLSALQAVSSSPSIYGGDQLLMGMPISLD